MKTSNRARRNTGKKSTSTQSANAPKNSPEKTQPETVILRFTGEANGETLNLAELQMPKEVYVALEMVAANNDMKLDELMPIIIREHLNREELERLQKQREQSHAGQEADARFDMVKFESMVNRASALIDLLVSKFGGLYENEIRSGPYYNPRIAKQVCGYMDLADGLMKEIVECFDMVCASRQAKGGAR